MHAARPRVALTLARTAAAAAATADLLAGAGPDTAAAVRAAADALGTYTTGEARTVVCDALAAFACRHLDTAADAAEVAFAAACGVGTGPGSLAGADAQLAALHAAGVPAAGLDPASLAPWRDHRAVRHLETHRLLLAARHAAAGGAARAAAEAAWDAVGPVGTVDDVVAGLAAAGLDGERLCWAVITFESHRHIRLVWAQANKLARTFPDRAAADLLGWGWQGLRVALRQYDPDRCLFSTYACPKIAGAIRDGVRSEHPLPKRLTTYVRKVAKAEEDLTQILGRLPRLSEVAAHVDADLELLSRCGPAASIDELVGGFDTDRPAEPGWLAGGADPADAALAAAAGDAIAEALAALPPEEADAVRLLVLEDRPIAEVRALTGATARQLRQRRERALGRLAVSLAAWAEPA